PAERVETGRAALVFDEIRKCVRGKLLRFAEPRTIECDEAPAVGVGQRREQHRVHDGVNRRRRGDAHREGNRREEGNCFCARPRPHGLRQRSRHARILARRAEGRSAETMSPPSRGTTSASVCADPIYCGRSLTTRLVRVSATYIEPSRPTARSCTALKTGSPVAPKPIDATVAHVRSSFSTPFDGGS